MTNRDELRTLRSIGEMEQEAERQLRLQADVATFEAKLAEVSERLEMRLRVAARKGYLELKLICVDSSGLVDLGKVCCIDHQRHSTQGGGWRTVNPYQEKSVVRNPALLALWNRLEAMSLQPIFIEGPYGCPIFGVQLPDGGPYPRRDSAEVTAQRTMNRMDEWLDESGGISFTPAA
ncbi:MULTISPECIES: hypothetical protein [unclassified Cupriavidus]|uniref:hypothetical protein n=1 Tax=unclassified Cupriavidus TaxID=2640874 RepID=UPI001AE8C17F|nr:MULTISPECIES: hypothetical protein [unclassified Cupriavidus]MBP0633464.1 hypothetical protein [Cupriavidus sp. AcVe19-1a]MBP0640145.1 hypothetical protein [Cupriavidus sp. AcVe19-6a]